MRNQRPRQRKNGAAYNALRILSTDFSCEFVMLVPVKTGLQSICPRPPEGSAYAGNVILFGTSVARLPQAVSRQIKNPRPYTIRVRLTAIGS